MHPRSHSWLVAGLLTVALFWASAAQAQRAPARGERQPPSRPAMPRVESRQAQEAPVRQSRSQPRSESRPAPTPMSDSVRRVQRSTGGKVLGAERVQYDGREINRVKYVDTEGSVRYMDDVPQQRRGADRRGDNDVRPARDRNPGEP